MDYSMDGTVYFQTLNEYKYNPALIIGSQTGNPVVAAAKGIVESIDTNEETGTTLTMNIGDNYELIYGQLKEVAVAQGDVVEQGELLGYVSEPTKYYCEEGSNLYFAMKKDGTGHGSVPVSGIKIESPRQTPWAVVTFEYQKNRHEKSG